ncbi:MAG: CsgG/HfaB family protein [Treponema sp.]|nr:CsgG/HfaB family protein [Treponema sp.]
MIKKLIAFVGLIALSTSLFAATIDSKFGYKDLKWGTSISKTKMAGYELNPVDDELLEAEQKGYKRNIKIFTLNNLQDKSVNQVWLYYVNDNLFYVMERLNKSEIKETKLASRYGKLNPAGFRKLENNLYGDAIYENDILQSETIKVQLFNDSAIAMLYDWEVYSKISKEALRETQKATVVDELEDVASELMNTIEGGRKASCAFVALSSDNNDKTTENYITDALTEAVFYLNKVKIVERSNLQKILEEQKFQSSGLVDENSAKEIGKIAGVDYVCYGTLKRSGDMFSVNSRIVDVQSGEVVAISRGDIRKDKYIIDKENAVKAAVEEQKRVEQEEIKVQIKKQEEKQKKAENSPWKVVKKKNEDTGTTYYTFTLSGNDAEFLFVGVEEQASGHITVQAGVYWRESSSEKEFDIKFDNNEIETKKLWNYQYEYFGGFTDKYNYDPYDQNYGFTFLYSRAVPANFFIKGFTEHEYFSIRRGNVARKFKTDGLIDRIEQSGLSWEKVKAAAELGEF